MGNHISFDEGSQNDQFLATGQPIPTLDNNEDPQQNLFTFDELSFDSRFEGGNLMSADKVGPGQYNLWTAPDCYKTEYETKQRIAFHFKVVNVNLQGFPTRTFTFKIMNMSKIQYKNYKEGMVPVYMSACNNNTWQYLPSPLTELNVVDGNTMEISFQYTFNLLDSQKGVFFAFTFPYTYTDNLNFVDYIERTYATHPSIYFHRELLTYSPGGRRLDLITITAHDSYSLNPGPPFLLEPFLPDLFPTHPRQLNEVPTLRNRNIHRPFLFKNKGYILLSARVHANESPANFILQGFILSLLNTQDPVSQALLKNFVFVIIPMLNPDGVAKGHYRSDLKGRDMNRAYDKALSSPQDLPGPYAVMQIAKCLASDKKLTMYIDLHAHSQINSGFILGTHHEDPEIMTEMRLFGRMLDIYSANFDFNSCSFGTKKECEDPLKAGIAKTAVRNATGIVHSYTMETSYHKSMKDPYRYSPQHNPAQDLNKTVSKRLGIAEFIELGESIRHAMLEVLLRTHPLSILPRTWYGDVQNVRNKIYENISENKDLIEKRQGPEDQQKLEGQFTM